MRISETALGSLEKRLLATLCKGMPQWITSDMLTAIGVVGAAVAAVAFASAKEGSPVLWLAILGLAMNWFGDSLDGSLARFRKAERPQYGFFLDHMTDALSMGLIALGVGFSSQVSMACALALLMAYYGMVILSITTCVVTGVFRISFNGMGPTEVRLAIIAGTVCAIYLPTEHFMLGTVTATTYDFVVLVAALCLVGCAIFHAFATARELARMVASVNVV